MWENSDPMKVHNGSVGDESVNHRKKSMESRVCSQLCTKEKHQRWKDQLMQ